MVVIPSWWFHSREQPPCSQSIRWSPWWVKHFLSNSRDPFKTIGSVDPLIPVSRAIILQNEYGSKDSISVIAFFVVTCLLCITPIFNYTDSVEAASIQCCELERKKNSVIASEITERSYKQHYFLKLLSQELLKCKYIFSGMTLRQNVPIWDYL